MLRTTISFFALSFFVMSPSFAAIRNSQDFTRLDKMYDEGSSFEFAEYLGWWSGRCWYSHSDEPKNGLLVMEQRETDGPAFPAVQKFSLYQWPDQKENFFDDHGVKPEGDAIPRTKHEKMIASWAETIKRDFDNDWKKIRVLTKEERGFSTSFANLRDMKLRRSADDKYFVLKRGGALLCYFFKKVENPVRDDVTR